MLVLRGWLAVATFLWLLVSVPLFGKSLQLTGTALVGKGQQNCSATMPASPGATYIWAILGGQIIAGNGSNMVTFNAGTDNIVVLACWETDPQGKVNSAIMKILVSGAESAPSQAIGISSQISQASPGQKGCSANTAWVTGAQYRWAIQNGSFEGPDNKNTVWFTAGDSGPVQLLCLETRKDATMAVGFLEIKVPPLGLAQDFTLPVNLATGQKSQVTISADPANLFEWTMAGGEILGSSHDSTVAFQVADWGTFNLSCKVTDPSSGVPITVAKGPGDALPKVAWGQGPGLFTGAGRSGMPGYANAFESLTAEVQSPPAGTATWSIQNGTIISDPSQSRINVSFRLACAPAPANRAHRPRLGRGRLRGQAGRFSPAKVSW